MAKLSTAEYTNNGVSAPKNIINPARIANAGIKHSANYDPINTKFGFPVIDIGQLAFAFRWRLVRTAEGQGRYVR